MKAIVYTSNAGSAKRYAEMLGAGTGLPVFPLSEAGRRLKADDEILYLGWIMAGGIRGCRKAVGKYRVRAVCAVGMAMPSEEYAQKLRAGNRLGTRPFFYLQGGFDMDRLHGVYRLMMEIMERTAGRSIKKKAEPTAEEAEMLEMFRHATDRVRPENLEGVLAWYRAQA